MIFHSIELEKSTKIVRTSDPEEANHRHKELFFSLNGIYREKCEGRSEAAMSAKYSEVRCRYSNFNLCDKRVQQR
jgi:hypothetical protein